MSYKADLQQRIDWLLSNRTTPAPPPLLNTIEQHAQDRSDEHGHKHEGEEEHRTRQRRNRGSIFFPADRFDQAKAGAVSGAEQQIKYRWSASIRVIANQIPRASVRTTLTYKFLPKLSGGIEYNPRADKVSPLANWLAISETKNRPALILGTVTLDRIRHTFLGNRFMPLSART